MNRLLSVVGVVGVVFAVSGRAHAERPVVAGVVTPSSCQAAASKVTAALAVDGRARVVLERRCEVDRWSRDAKVCFSSVGSSTEASLCLDTLSKSQRKAVEGDADRLRDMRLSRWLLRQTLVAPAPITVTLASYDPTQARALHAQGMTAYQHGNYDVSSKKFAAAAVASPTADNVYLAAQAYRMKGDRARSLELYERYLELAPSGPAAPACRYQIERLRDSLP